MCRYKRATECSTAMHSSRMCHACYQHNQNISRRKRVGNVSERPTLAELVARHSRKPICQVWV